MRKLSLVAAVAVTPFMGLPAWASTCVLGSVATYEAVGFTCSVGGVTFSNISVSTITGGSGTVNLGNFTPFTIGGESGLSLNYDAETGSTPGSIADVAWTYNVAGNLLDDAFAEVAGNVTGTGSIVLSEILSNGVSLSLSGPGSTTATFAPISTLFVIKDQNDFAGTAGSATTSILTNAFSVTTTPIPGALPLFATGLFGLWGLRRKRKSAAAA
jgi:hypothetical protein